MDGQGFHVTQLESYFSLRHGKQLFAATFARYGALKPRKLPRTYTARTFTQHAALASAWTLEGYAPTNVSVVSVNGTLSYSALWEYGNPKIIDMEEHLTPQTLQARFDANAKEQRFLTYLKGYQHHGATQYSAVWIGGAPNGTVSTNLRLAQLNTTITQQRRKRHLLRGLSGHQLDGDTAYTAIFEP